jgi:pimeloyl-ACP methyl ester carboxylesterase
MAYARFGRGNRHLILLPGLSDGLATVRGKALLLAAPYRPFLDDFTIWMLSRKDDMPGGFTIRDMARDQALAMDLLGIRKASVMGVSQGGMIAQALAIRHPDLITKLIIAVSAPNANDLAKENVNRWLEIVSKNDHKALMIDTAEHYYSEGYRKKYRLMYPFLGMVGKPKSYERFIRNAQAILAFDTFGRLKLISCPTLILAGRNDQIVGVQASLDMHEQIAGSDLYIYEENGHAPNEEDRHFYDRIFAWLKKEH